MPAERMENEMHKQKGRVSDEVESSSNSQAGAACVGGAAAQPQPAGAGGGSRDTPPSNTVSYNCNSSGGFSFQPLRWGVDSLYLSYKGNLDIHVDADLKKLKEKAQSHNPMDVGLAQYRVGEHLFQVKDKGAGLFPYILENYAYRIQLPKATSKALPLAYVKVSSGILAAREVKDIESEAYDLAGKLGTVEGYANAGRIDLFVDFVTDVDLEGWDRSAWVTRASAINSYSIDGAFSGWAIGLGGAIAARLYDKTLEIRVSRKDYLKGLWSQAGWDGEAHVWRLEFQLKRETLSQLDLKDFALVMNNLGGIWSYAMTQWLKLTLPNPDDKTRSRWPVHPLWAALASIDWETSGGSLLRSYAKNEAPSDEWLFNAGLRPVVSWMAKGGITDLDTGLKLFRERMVSYHEGQAYRLGINFSPYIREKVQLKTREYGTGYNLNEIPDEDRQRDVDAAAVDYRRLSDGYNPNAVDDKPTKKAKGK